MSAAYIEPICVAQAIYHEARSDSDIGKRHVGELVWGRARDWHVSTCYIIKMPGQFPIWPKDKIPKKELNQWSKAVEIARQTRESKSTIRYMVLKTVYHHYRNEHTLYESRYHVFYNRFRDPLWRSVEDGPE